VQTEFLQATEIRSASEADPFLDAWRELAAGAPMRTPEWLLGWWEIYAASKDELCILLVQEAGGALVGLAPLYLQESRRTFRVLGASEACTHHTNWFTAPGWESRVGVEVGRHLLKCKSDWNRLLFESVDADAVAIHATMDYLAEKGFLRHQRQVNSCWKIALPRSWDDYLRMLSKSHRKRCRKLQRQFFDSGKIQVHQAESAADLEEGFAVLLKLHAARWGSAKYPLGVFNDQRFLAFHRKVSKELLVSGNLRLAWLECEGQPLAAEYQFVDSKAVYAYQAGVDLAMGQYSPGKLSMISAIRFAIAQDCEFFDLLRGDEPYKSNWRATPVACYDLRVWQARPKYKVAWVMWSGYTLAVRRLQPIIPHCIIHLGLKLFQAMRAACRLSVG
jgi:CelD/BcsL family acetyltransferase involved in cellulose biosynthesis